MTMLDSMRRHKNWLKWSLALVVLAFIALYFPSYMNTGTTIGASPSSGYLSRVLRNGLLFHERWDSTIARQHPRPRRTWTRQATPRGWIATVPAIARAVVRRGRS